MKLFFLIFSEFFLYFKGNLITINSIKFSKKILKNPKNYQKSQNKLRTFLIIFSIFLSDQNNNFVVKFR